MKTLLALLLPASALLALDPASFTSRGIGAGGGMFSPSISPHDASTMFLAIDMSNVFRTLNAGSSWQIIDFTQLQGKQLTEVQFTSTPATLYAADQRRTNTEATINRPVKSTDLGLTWTTFANWPSGQRALSVWSNPQRDDTFLVCYTTGSVSRIAFYQSAGTSGSFSTAFNFSGAQGRIAGVFFDGNECWVATNQGLLYSNNGGATLSAVNAPASGTLIGFAGGKDSGTGQRRFYAVTTSAAVSGQSWAQNFGNSALTNKVWCMDWSSTASTWSDVTGTIPTSEKPNLVAMARNQADVVYVATSTNVFPYACNVWRISAAGGSWQSILNLPVNGNLITGWGGITDRTTVPSQPKVEADITYSVPCGLAVSPVDSNTVVLCDNAVIHRCTNAAAASPLWQQVYTTNDNTGHVAGQFIPAGQSYLSTGLEITVSTTMNWAAPTLVQAAMLDVQTIESTTGGKRWGFPYDHTTLGGGDCNAVAHDAQTGRLFAAVGFINTVYEFAGQDDANTDNTGPTGTTKLAPGVYHRLPGATTWTVLKNDFGVSPGQRGANPVWMTADSARRKLYICIANSNVSTDGIYVFDLDNLASTPVKLPTPTRVVNGTTYNVQHPFNVRVLADGSLLASYGPHQQTNSSGAYKPTSGVFLLPVGTNTWIDRTDPRMFYHTRDVIIDPANPTRWFACVWNTDLSSVTDPVTDPVLGGNVTPQTQGGLWRSETAGTSWTRLWQGDTTYPGSATSCTIHPETALAELYLTTRFGGLWKTDDCRAVTPIFNRVSSYGFRAPERLYYDPYDHDKLWITSNGYGITEATRLSTLGEWQTRWFGQQSGAAASTADADGDGALNALEYALHGDPLASGQIIASSASANLPVHITFQRNLAATDATWIIEASSDLAQWSTLSQATGTGIWTAPTSGTLNQTEDGFVTFDDGVAPGSMPRRFLRVRVTTP
ncbi:MAG: hypothetical protein U1F71_18720 [Verrucomicrobiaceae bacterium]